MTAETVNGSRVRGGGQHLQRLVVGEVEGGLAEPAGGDQYAPETLKVDPRADVLRVLSPRY
jgi:hypothetical protein